MPLLSKCFPCFKFKREEVIDKLDYSNTPLTDFPEVWQHERTLEELYLSTTRVGILFGLIWAPYLPLIIFQLQALPPQLFYCQGLRVLHVNSNNLESIPQAIGSLRQLQHLDLNRNREIYTMFSIQTLQYVFPLQLLSMCLRRSRPAST